MELVLSLFPGIGVLDKGFEEAGFCVVRGPDLLWGGDVREFHPPAGRFEGVIGGPPCQVFSRVRYVNPLAGASTGNLIPEFERVVDEAKPIWFLMENVREAPLPSVPGYEVRGSLLNNRWLGGAQNRVHRFSFGLRGAGLELVYDEPWAVFEAPVWEHRVCASDTLRGSDPGKELRAERNGHKAMSGPGPRNLEQCLELQGLPAGFFEGSPFLKRAQGSMVGNAVAYPMAQAVARAVRSALDRWKEKEHV